MASLDASVEPVLADRYRLRGLLGHGGMSDVFRADDLLDHRTVALKIVRSDDPSLTDRLVQEASALERLDHPALVRLLDTGTVDGRAYLAMELVDGPTLAETLARGPLVPTRAAQLGRTVAEALAYVHEAGIVHRDVKPANVMFDERGEVRLCDFGIARLLDSSTLTADGTTLGTAAYMAPEQVEDHGVGPAADVWSLGIVLLEALTGRRVFEGSAGEVLARRQAGPVPIPDALPTPWRLLLAGMLERRPERRLRDREVAALLSTVAFDDAPGAVDPPPTPREQLIPFVTTTLAATGAGGTPTLVATGTGGSPTRVSPVPPQLVTDPRSLRRRRRARLAVLCALLCALIAGGAYALVSASTAPTAHQSAKTAPPPRHTTAAAAPPPTITSDTTPAGSGALATLEGDVQQAVAGGSLDGTTGSTVTDDASAAVTSAAQGDASGAADQLQKAATAVAEGVATGSASLGTGARLEGDLVAVASALVLAPPVDPLSQVGSTATTAPPAAAPTGGGPAHHHGGGGHGDQG